MKSGIKIRSIDKMSGTSPAAAAVANFVTICGLGMTVNSILLSCPAFQASTIFRVNSSPSLRTHILSVVAVVTGTDAIAINDVTAQKTRFRRIFRHALWCRQNEDAELPRRPLRQWCLLF